jgi:transposase-like protein
MRRHYPAEKRTRLLALVTSGGVSICEAARQLGVRPATAYYWVRQAARAPTAPVATKALAAAAPTFVQLIRATATTSSVEVRIGAAVIAVKPGFDAELLRAVVVALSGGAA